MKILAVETSCDEAAAMAGAAAFFNYKPKRWREISANASMLF